MTGPHEAGGVGEDDEEKGEMSLKDEAGARFLKNGRADVPAVSFKDQPERTEDSRWQDYEDQPPAHAHERQTEQ